MATSGTNGKGYSGPLEGNRILFLEAETSSKKPHQLGDQYLTIRVSHSKVGFGAWCSSLHLDPQNNFQYVLLTEIYPQMTAMNQLPSIAWKPLEGCPINLFSQDSSSQTFEDNM